MHSRARDALYDCPSDTFRSDLGRYMPAIDSNRCKAVREPNGKVGAGDMPGTSSIGGLAGGYEIKTPKKWRRYLLVGGEGGDRTHGPVARTAVFETARFGHSRTSPHGRTRRTSG